MLPGNLNRIVLEESIAIMHGKIVSTPYPNVGM
jgi:hypothetical protein